MTGIFDGLARVVNATFGGPVTVIPAGGAEKDIQAIFREEPYEKFDEFGEGSVATVRATLGVLKADAALLAEGDKIQPGNGKTYELSAPLPDGSPASDAFVQFDLTVTTAP